MLLASPPDFGMIETGGVFPAAEGKVAATGVPDDKGVL
jgi:hypothetical protein